MTFSDAMQSVFGALDWLPVADGNIHRFYVPGDRVSTRNGWYVLYADGIASGFFGSWKDIGSHSWNSRKPIDHLEEQLIRRRIEQTRYQHEAEQRCRQQVAAKCARKLWRDAERADASHPYLRAKGCNPHGLRQQGELLLVPMTYDAQLVNLQRISPDGSKRFLSGGLIKGACSPLGKITAGQPLYLCEGWATGATLHEESGSTVACAMNAGNLLAVGRRLQRQHPEALLIVAGDNDQQTKGNPGKTAATAAASSLGCGLVLPPWPIDAPPHLSDFNDLRQWQRENA